MRLNKDQKKLVISIAVGAFASFAVFNMLHSMNEKLFLQTVQINTQGSIISELKKNIENGSSSMPSDNKIHKYFVAKDEIKAGTKLTEELLTLTEFNFESPKAYSSTVNLSGKIVAKNIKKDQILENSDMLDADFERGNLPNGMRAVTIPVSYIEGLASYIRIGTRLDILSTAKSKNEASKIVLQNVKIVSFEAKPTLTDKPAQIVYSAVDAAAVTLQIPANSSEKLVYAMQEGKLLFVTRSGNDPSNIIVTTKKTYPINESFDLPKIPENMKISSPKNIDNLPDPAMPINRNTVSKVEVIQADIKTEVTFDNE